MRIDALMIIVMKMDDDEWLKDYVEVVPALLHEYGAEVLAGSRRVSVVEGDADIPDRVAVLSFPNGDAAVAFLADPRYASFSQLRRSRSRSTILVFDNELNETRPLA